MNHNNTNHLHQTLSANAEPAQNAEAFWQAALSQLRAGPMRFIQIPLRVIPLVGGQEGIDMIINRFRSLIEAEPVVAPYPGHLLITPPAREIGSLRVIHQTDASNKKAPKVKKVPRPSNAWILYRQANHPLVKAQDPTLHNNAISKKLGMQWAREPEEVKDYWKLQSHLAKEQHERDYPGYVYQPRKPHEKKRRMTRRKREAMMSTHLQESQYNATAPEVSPPTADSITELELSKTIFGNIVLELGDESVPSQLLETELEAHNLTQQIVSVSDNIEMNKHCPAAIFSQRTEGNQNTVNFFDPLIPEAEADWSAMWGPNLLDTDGTLKSLAEIEAMEKKAECDGDLDALFGLSSPRITTGFNACE